VRSLEGRLGKIVTEAYIRCLGYTHGMVSLVSVPSRLRANDSLQVFLYLDPSLLSLQPSVSRNVVCDLELGLNEFV
jgi:hypothetical protein